MRTLRTSWLGEVPYGRSYELQGELQDRRARDDIDDTLLLLTHPHVYTIGRRGQAGDVLWDADALRARGVEVVEVDRGGQVTYHGPGQLVGYPIVHLGDRADLMQYCRGLEEVLIRTLAVYGIDAVRDPGNAGVWVGDSKIAALGIRVTRGVTKHGFALNVSPDLSYFAGIVPCGILDRGVTSIRELLGDAPEISRVARTFEREFAEVFSYEAVVPAKFEVRT